MNTLSILGRACLSRTVAHGRHDTRQEGSRLVQHDFGGKFQEDGPVRRALQEGVCSSKLLFGAQLVLGRGLSQGLQAHHCQAQQDWLVLAGLLGDIVQ